MWGEKKANLKEIRTEKRKRPGRVVITFELIGGGEKNIKILHNFSSCFEINCFNFYFTKFTFIIYKV